MSKFAAHLHAHSRVSVKDGLPSPEKLIDQARKLGFKAIALTDHGTMGGHYMFAKEAAKKKDDNDNPLSPIKPIFGVEAYICDDINFKQFVTVTDEQGNKRRKAPKNNHLVLLAKNETGYSNMLRLSKIAAIEGYYRDPRIDWNVLSENHEGLICTSACIGGEVGRAIEANNIALATEIADRHKQLFKDDYYLEIQNHGTPDERKIYEGICRVADDLGIKLIATNDVHYLDQSDSKAHNVLVSLRFQRDTKQGGSSDSRNLDSAYKSPEFWMKGESDMVKAFDDWRPEALSNVQEVVEKCEFTLPTAYPLVWPSFEFDENDPELIAWRNKYVPEQSLIQAYLSREARRGLVAKGLHKDPVYAERLKYELNSIYDLGYEKYFLVQLQIVGMCDELGIMMGCGRGCLGGDSLVLTADSGFVPLRDIKVGTEVYTHDGSLGEVEQTFEYPVDEPLLKIKTDNSISDIVMTKDHLVYGVAPVETEKYQKGGATTKKSVKRWDWVHAPGWISASNIKPNDLLFMPFPERKIIESHDIDLAEHVSGRTYRITDTEIILLNPLTGGEISRHARYIPFDEDFSYFLGYWIGDGWTISNPEKRKSIVGLAFHSDDTELISRFSTYFQRMGFRVKTKKAKDRKLLQMHIYNKVLMSALRSIFPDYRQSSHTKYIGSLKYLPENMLRSLMVGLKHADGHTSNKKNHGVRESIDTVSFRLALDIKEALLFLKIPSSISQRTHKDAGPGEYQMSPSYTIRFIGLEAKRGGNYNNKIQKDGYYVRVSGVEETSEAEVFDLKIKGENHSYMTGNYAVHNSGAGSLVLYCLGITKVDPMKYGLLFERFLNAGRGPQLDQVLPLEEFGKEMSGG